MKQKTIKLFKPKINEAYLEFHKNADPILKVFLPLPSFKIISKKTETKVEITIKTKKLEKFQEELMDEIKRIISP